MRHFDKKDNFMKTRTFLTMLFLVTMFVITSCASNYRRPESFDSKMSRFETKNVNKNPVPEISLSGIKMKKSRGRMPASFDGGESYDRGPKPKTTHSNKRLYFLTLFSQYQTLKQYSKNSAPEIATCPHFHTSLTTHNEKHASHHPKQELNFKKIDYTKVEDPSYLTMNPILNLPAVKNESQPKVADLVKKPEHKEKWLTVQKALDIHIAKNYQELMQLCEEGASENYYAFQNLITHVNTDPSFTASNENMKVLLSTILFANESIIQSSKRYKKRQASRGIASVGKKLNPYMNDVMYRLNAGWASRYFKTVSKK
jgi:hypothetical protein